MSLFEAANYVEAGWWGLCGLLMAGHAVRSPRWPRSSVACSVALFLFGLSDVVEAGTGAWWRPWWLLTWKCACILVLLAANRRFLRRQMA